ncbi:hypothetical protein AVEN_14136-1 [Araneus ventricosus]|uniref:Uncharacterized protein n=1 Tax=Araneus ventricosus TaxID=182803 RepID=A0A4Y2FW33_ARAVE|nr:hypothetical protein AVEN_14136-1 [Araneus ventricosus]
MAARMCMMRKETGDLLSLLNPSVLFLATFYHYINPFPFNRFGCHNGIRHWGMVRHSVITEGSVAVMASDMGRCSVITEDLVQKVD